MNTTNTTLINTMVREINADEDGIQLVYTVTEQNGAWLTLTTEDGVTAKARKNEILGDAPAYEVVTADQIEEDQDDEDGEAQNKMAKQLQKYRTAYVPTIAASGRKSLSNGDALAKALEGMLIQDLYAAANSILGQQFEDRYGHLNMGSQRMNLGNRIRAALKKEDHEAHQAAVEWLEAALEATK